MRVAFCIFSFVCLMSSSYSTTALASSQKHQKKVFHATWYVAHTPDNNRLVKQAQEFAHRLEERSKGHLQVELKFPEDTFKDGNNFRRAVQMVRDNEAQISQIGTTHLASLDPQFQLFDLPFLFRSHEHAAKVFDGEIGAKLKEHYLVASNDSVRPLAFTYSGGYRVFVSNKPLSKASQLEGLKMHFYGPKANASETISQNLCLTRLHTVLAFKMTPVMNESHPEYYSQLEFFKNNDVDIAEDHFSHFTRLLTKIGVVRGKMDYVWETNHSLFLTSIVVNEKFFQSMPKNLQSILQEEAQRLALLEREDSIKTDQAAKRWLINSGYTVTQISEEEKQVLIKASHAVYEKVGPQIGLDLIHSVEALN